jgi:RimJ/RimL family protein N-acetyltransferase
MKDAIERGISPAYRIETPRLVLRCWNPADAALLKEAVDSSVEHLRPWMPWAADDPQPLENRITLIRHWRSLYDRGEDFVVGVFDRAESMVLGGSGLHTRVGPRGMEIGYWIRVSHINQGYATEVAAALTTVAFRVHGVDRVEIHCNPANVRSAAVPRKLGYTHEATLLRREPRADGELRDLMVWTLFADAYPASPAASLPVTAFDAAGRIIE